MSEKYILAFPIISRSSRPNTTAERKKGAIARRSIKFILSQTNLPFLGQTASLEILR